MYRFIVVDDEYIIRKGILKKIEKLDLNIVPAGEAENGKQAVELIKNQDPHIIITDMRMPVMDGKTFLQVLQKDFPDKKIIVISGYSDFEYMQEAISSNVVSYLLKPYKKEDIQSAILKAISLIEREQELRQKVEMAEEKYENAARTEDISNLCQYILSPFDAGRKLRLNSAKMQDIQTAGNLVLLCISSANELDDAAITQIISTNDNPLKHVYIPNYQNPGMGFLLYYFSEGGLTGMSGNIDKIVDVAALLSSSYSRMTGFQCYIGISSVKRSTMELHQAFLEAVSALNRKKICDDRQVFVFLNEQEVFLNGQEIMADMNRMDKLLFYIESGNSEKVSELTNEFFDFLTGVPEITLAQLKLECQNLFDGVRNLAKIHLDTVTCNSFASNCEKILLYCFNPNMIKGYTLKLLSDISALFRDKNIYPSNELVNNIKKYVRNNYNKELTLEKIAEMFFVNRSYCSTLFNEKTGMSFTDYVNRIRTEKAKELLRDTNIRIFKIAKSLGYSNTKYFFRIFKKLAGCTPEEYRSRQLQGMRQERNTELPE